MDETTARLSARRELITTGPIASVLWKLTVPAAVWYLLNYSFFIADAYFIGKLGTQALGAMGLLSAVVVVVTTLAQGLGAALAAVASIYLGADQHRAAAKLTTHTLLLGLGVALLVPALGVPTIEPLFRMLGASDAQLPEIRQYMTVTYMGFAFVVLPSVAQSGIRSTGDVLTPALILLGSGTINVVLDPLLIFGVDGLVPAMGVSGAAVATLASRVLGTVASLYLLGRRDRLLLPTLSDLRASWSVILRIGLPVAAQMSTLAIVGAVNMRVAADMAPALMAGLGVGYRIEAAATAMLFGLPVILPTFIGQNIGAGNPTRAGEGILTGSKQVIGCQLVIAGLLAACAPVISARFSADPEVRTLIEQFLWIVPISYGAHTVTAATAGTFIALGRMRDYLTIGVVPALVLGATPLIAAHFYGATGLLSAMCIARIAVGIVAGLWLRRVLLQTGLLEARPSPAVEGST